MTTFSFVSTVQDSPYGEVNVYVDAHMTDWGSPPTYHNPGESCEWDIDKITIDEVDKDLKGKVLDVKALSQEDFDRLIDKGYEAASEVEPEAPEYEPDDD